MDPSSIPSETLVTRMAAEDQQALSELYDRHRVVVFSLALRILGDRAEAEEVLSDVFFQAWRSAAGFDPLRGSVSAWLMTLCRSRAIDRLRRRERREGKLAPGDPEAATAVPSPAEAEEAMDVRAHRTRIRSALSMLTADQRAALDLAYYGGLSHSEIAAQLGQPLGTIKTRIRQGLLSLKKSLVEQFT